MTTHERIEMHTQAKDLHFGDTVAYQNDFHHVIEAKVNYQGGINVWLSPTDGLGLDVKIGVPKQFCFFVTNRLQS